MKATLLAAFLVGACAMGAMAQTSAVPAFSEATAQASTPTLMSWWDRANFVCVNQTNGEINQACLDRTALSGVLEKRGYCQSELGGTQWRKCIVGGGNDNYTGENPSLQQYLRDRNTYYLQGIEPNGNRSR